MKLNLGKHISTQSIFINKKVRMSSEIRSAAKVKCELNKENCDLFHGEEGYCISWYWYESINQEIQKGKIQALLNVNHKFKIVRSHAKAKLLGVPFCPHSEYVKRCGWSALEYIKKNSNRPKIQEG